MTNGIPWEDTDQADALKSFNTRMGTNLNETTTLQTFRKTVKRIPVTIVPLTCSDFPRVKVTEWVSGEKCFPLGVS
jgi:hypothetical protein